VDARWWRTPLLAAAGTLAAVVACFFVLLPRLATEHSAAATGPQADPRAAAETGRRALADGNFFLAARELSAASLLPAGGRSAAELRELDQLRRQADLLSRLHGRSLQEILGEALPLRRDDEWKARFREQHEGKAVVFDDVVVRDAAGRPSLAVYRVRVGDERARVAVDDLRLLARLPIDPPRRLLFGGRLADLVREDGGAWAFRFHPDSAVLLTDAGAVAACIGPVDADLMEVLRRQERWLAEVAPRTEAP
jgi:hypothetical protein